MLVEDREEVLPRVYQLVELLDAGIGGELREVGVGAPRRAVQRLLKECLVLVLRVLVLDAGGASCCQFVPQPLPSGHDGGSCLLHDGLRVLRVKDRQGARGNIQM